jgi:hypothetical protein
VEKYHLIQKWRAAKQLLIDLTSPIAIGFVTEN